MDIAQLVTALTGILALLSGFVISRRGQQATAREQTVADHVASDRSRLEETQQALDTYELLARTLTAEAQRTTASADKLRSDLEEERRAHTVDTVAFAVIEQRCRTQSATVVDGLAVLQTNLTTDDALRMIRRIRDDITDHPHDTTPIRTASWHGDSPLPS